MSEGRKMIQFKPITLGTALSILLGILLILLGLAVLLMRPDVNPQVFWVVRVLVALGAGFAAAGLGGTLIIEGPVLNIVIKAGGPFALTVLLYLVNPLNPVARLLSS